MPDIGTKQKYMMKRDLAMEVADLVGIDTYDPSRTKSPPADFLRHERLQIYEAVTGESGEELSQREMNNVMIQELGSELHSAYPFDLTKEDLKLIHEELVTDREEQ
jgi:hypothetical protein